MCYDELLYRLVNQTIRKEYAECGHSTAEPQASEVACGGGSRISSVWSAT